MNLRRLPFLMLVVVLAVPAQADEHNMEFSAGFSPGSLTGRGSYAYRFWSKPYPNVDPEKKGKESLFGFGEVGLHLSGTGSGRTLEDWSGGLRYRTCGECSIEPFGHVMFGGRRPSRADDDDPPTKLSFVGGVGLGFDYELNADKTSGSVWLFRFQIDVLESRAIRGFDHYGRATAGFVLRPEPQH